MIRIGSTTLSSVFKFLTKLFYKLVKHKHDFKGSVYYNKNGEISNIICSKCDHEHNF